MNIAAFVEEAFRRAWERNVFLATVTGTAGDKVTIIPSTDDAAAGSYAALASYDTPTADDTVLCLRVGGGILVVGKVLL
jgi:exopolyphosphatase/pppGpp-phosphohydrolase